MNIGRVAVLTVIAIYILSGVWWTIQTMMKKKFEPSTFLMIFFYPVMMVTAIAGTGLAYLLAIFKWPYVLTVRIAPSSWTELALSGMTKYRDTDKENLKIHDPEASEIPKLGHRFDSVYFTDGSFSVGQEVIVLSGSLENCQGRIDSISDNGLRLRVVIPHHDRLTSVEVSPFHVQLSEKST
jgi:hypothetical protein